MAVRDGGAKTKYPFASTITGFFERELVDVEKEMQTETSNELRERLDGESPTSYISDMISSVIPGPEPRNADGVVDVQRKRNQEDFDLEVQAGGITVGKQEFAIAAGLGLLVWVLA